MYGALGWEPAQCAGVTSQKTLAEGVRLVGTRPCAVATGGAGFLGSYLCERLLDEGYRVVCVDNMLTGSLANVAHLADTGSFELVEADVCDGIRVEGDVTYVLHFASPASPREYLRHPVDTLRVGSVGTLNALELARDKRARFLLASTSEVYGDPKQHPQRESYWGNVNPNGPRSVYDEAKRFAESATVAYRRRHGVDTAIVRIFNTFGPRMRADDGRLVPTFIAQAMRNEPMTIAGRGAQTRSLCYVTDLIDGVLRLLLSEHAGPINIGNVRELSVHELATIIRELTTSRSEFAFVRLPTDDPGVRRPDISLAASLLGWQPKVTVEEGLKATIAWFTALEREHGMESGPLFRLPKCPAGTI